MRCKIPTKDLGLKLNDTICRYDGEPVYIRTTDGRLCLYRLTDTNTYFTVIKGTDEKLDVSSPALGYTQYRNKVYYLSRVPVRRTKQGLATNAISLTPLGAQDNPYGKGMATQVVFQQGFIDMVVGKYPTLENAMKALRADHAKNPKESSQIAISRSIALEINAVGIINVYYKEMFVGWIQPNRMTVHVPRSDMSWIISKYLGHELSWEVD